MANTLQETSDAPLDIADRCDRCGGRARHRITLHNGELYLCDAHYLQHADALALVVKIPRKL